MWLPDRGERDLEKEGLNNREVVKRTHDHKHNPYHIYSIIYISVGWQPLQSTYNLIYGTEVSQLFTYGAKYKY